MKFVVRLSSLLGLLSSPVMAQDIPDVPNSQSTSSAEAVLQETPTAATIVTTPAITIPAMTPVELEILAPINSKTAKIGEMFPIKLVSPIVIDGRTIVPAGATGQGEVVHAAKARAAGKAGELILAARYVEWDNVRIPLRSFKFGRAAGENRTGTAIALGVVVAAPLALFVAGGQVDVAQGAAANAKIASDTIINISQPTGE
jgi:hypothetical protein